MMLLSDGQRLDWLRLIRSERVGPRTFRALVNQFGGAGPALDALPDLARRTGRRTIRVASRAEAEGEMEALDRLGGRFVAMGEPGYPLPLQATDTAPPLLALRGAVEVLGRPAVAIVGSRNASATGLAFTERLATGLGQAGLVIASGLARGIDTRAHRASLPTGTVAVLAGGHDRVYPSENVPLLDRILAEEGAVLSEMPLGWEPRGRDFPRRNRIVSGISYGVVVVEAARRSGSLITARFALEQGREVFAVPGSPLDPRSEGTNELIRGGATLCAGADHVISVLTPLLAGDASAPSPPTELREDLASGPVSTGQYWDELDEASSGEGDLFDERPGTRSGEPGSGREILLALLGPSPVSVDDLARQAELPVREVQLALVEMELFGTVERHPGGAVSIRPA